MIGRMTVIDFDGKQTVTALDAPPGLEVLQKAVGGYIEVVPHFNTYNGASCIALCNEEGKNNNLPANVAATLLWEDSIKSTFAETWMGLDYLVGPIVILTGDNELLAAF